MRFDVGLERVNVCYMLPLDLTSIWLPALIYGEEYKLQILFPVAVKGIYGW
jgi:hypothetical protein